jgi:VCBS repeat-containing protein
VASAIADQVATEDSPFSYTFAAITFNDVDVGDTLAYSATGVPSWLTFNAATRTFAGTPANADVGAATITVRATDGSGAWVEDQFVLTVANVNDAPAITSNGGGATASMSVAENTTAVTTVAATDADVPAQTLSYSIAGGADAALFSINASTGVLTFLAAPNYEAPTDANADNVYEVTVQASDGSLTDTQAVSVTVLDSTTGDVLFASQDTYIVRTQPTLNYGQASSLILDKSGGAIGDSRVLVQFDLSAIPVGATITNAVLVMNATQNGGALSLDVYRVTSVWTEGTGNGAVGAASWNQRLSGINWSASGGDYDGIAVATINTGATGQHQWDVTSLVTAWHQNNQPNYGLIVGSQDTGGTTVTYDSAEGGFAPRLVVSFSTTNSVPQITSDGGGATANINVAENGAGVTTVSATDIDVPAQTLTYSIVGGADAARFQINASTGVLSFVTAPDYENPTDAGANNIYDVTVQVSDGVGGTDAQTLSVSVTNANEAPGFTSTAVTAGTQGVAYTYNISAADQDAGASLVISASTLPSWLTLTDHGNGTATLSGTPANGDVGNHTVQLQVSDGSLAATQNFTITVANVNDAPTVANAIPDQNGTQGVAFSYTVPVNAFADVDAGDSLTYSASGVPPWLTFNAGTRTFTGTPANADVGSVSITVRAVDGTGAWVEDQFTLTVANVNDAPVITSDGGGATASVSIPENSTAVTTVTATDIDLPAQTLTYSIAGGADAARFSINASTGVLTFLAAPNYEAPTDANADNVYEVTVQASDGSLTDTQAISVTVANVNEAPVANADSASGSEDIPVTGNVLANDTDVENNSLTATLVTGPVHGSLTLNGDGSYSYIPNADWNGADGFSYQTSDGTLASNVATVTLTITPVNDAPVIAGGATASMSVAENTTAVTTVTATDVDVPAQTLSYSIVPGADAALFSINASTGVLTFLTAPNYEAPTDANADNVYEVTVQASDGSLTDTQAISVSVTPANDNAPVITSNGGGATASMSVAENTTVVTTVAATDADLPAQTLTYSMAGGADAALFTINGASGALTFTTAPNYEAPADANADNVYEVIVRASDGSLTDNQSLSVTVTDQNESAVGGVSDIAAATNQVAENAANGSAVGIRARAIEPDVIDTVTYSLDDNAGGRFQIDTNSGVVTVANGSLLDYEVAASHSITVRATSTDTTSSTAVFIIDLVPVNDNAPVITSNGGGATASVSIPENSLTVTTVTATDADLPADVLSYGVVGGADATLFHIDSASGVLTFLVAPNFDVPTDANSDNVYEVTVQASDGTFTDTQAISVSLTNVNEAPAITSTAVTAAAEDTAYAYNITAGDPDAGASLVISAPTLPAWLTLTDYGNGTATLSGTPANANVGSHNVVLQVSDGNLIATQSFTIAVGNTNDAPTVASAIADQVATEDSPFSYTFAATTFNDVDVGDTLAYSATGVPSWLTFNAATRTFAGTPANADVGAATITVRATDGSGAWVEDQFVLTVANVNDAPAITSNGGGATASMSVAENTTAVTTVTATDIDLPAQTLTYSIAGGADAPRFSINASTGVLTFLTAPNYEAPTDANADNVYEVTVQASDGSLTDTQAISVAVVNVNEAPVLTANTINIQGGQRVTLTAANLDGTDVDSPLASIVYTVVAPEWGHFELAGDEGVPVTSFSRSQVLAGSVVFVSDTPAMVPGYSIVVSDGGASAGPVAADVVFMPVGMLAPPDTGAPAVTAPRDSVVTVTAEKPKTPVRTGSEAETAEAILLDAPPAAGRDSAPSSQMIETADSRRTIMVPTWMINAAAHSNVDITVPTRLLPFELQDVRFSLAESLKLQALEVVRQGMGSQGYAQALDRMRQSMENRAEFEHVLVGASVAASGSLSVGYVLWLLRGGALIGSLLSALPAWTVLDPVPVLAYSGKRGRGKDKDDELSERMFDKPKASRVKGRVAKAAKAAKEPK